VTNAVRWLGHPAASSLRVVHGVADGALAELAAMERPQRWEAIGFRSFNSVDELLPQIARAREIGLFPSLRSLDLSDLQRFEARVLERVVDHPAGAGLRSFATRAPLAEIADAVRFVAARTDAPARVVLRSERWQREPLSGIEATIDRGPPLTVAAQFRGSTWSADVLAPLVEALAAIDPSRCARLTLDLAPTLRKKPGIDDVLAPLRDRFADRFVLA
jgi:hypothetical protein